MKRIWSNDGRSALALAAVMALTLTLGACDGGSGSDLADAYRRGGAGETPGTAGAATGEQLDIMAMGHTAGAEDAPIQVVEFSDFGCPHCQAFHMGSYPEVHQRWVESGQVLWRYIPFALGNYENSVPAARAGECAIEQEAFPGYRDRLFESQEEWLYAENAGELFARYAEEEGLDASRFQSCIQEGRREEQVRQNLQLARQVQVRGTPTFIIQGQRVQGNQPPEFFDQVFEQMLAELEGPDGATTSPEGEGSTDQ